MKKVLVTGGTIFVSRYIAEYYVAKDMKYMFSIEIVASNQKV